MIDFVTDQRDLLINPVTLVDYGLKMAKTAFSDKTQRGEYTDYLKNYIYNEVDPSGNNLTISDTSAPASITGLYISVGLGQVQQSSAGVGGDIFYEAEDGLLTKFSIRLAPLTFSVYLQTTTDCRLLASCLLDYLTIFTKGLYQYNKQTVGVALPNMSQIQKLTDENNLNNIFMCQITQDISYQFNWKEDWKYPLLSQVIVYLQSHKV